MKIQNTSSNASFKGLFVLKGDKEILDEVCWYMQRKHQKPESKFGFVDLRNAFDLPSGFGKASDDTDLFITCKDKDLFVPKLPDLMTESLNQNLPTMTLPEKLKKLLSELSNMDDRVSQGKPILGLNRHLVAGAISKVFQTPMIGVSTAEDAFEGIQKGSFDIVEGTFRVK